MQEAIKQANIAKDLDEVPIGAVVVKNSKIIGRGFNQNILMHSVTAHAEINAINDAGQFLKNYRLIDCDIYVTLEPCHMCAKAIVDARIKNLYFATPEPKSGAVISIDNLLDKNFLNHHVGYQFGLMQQESSQLLKNFFSAKRS
jgi:tRNA(adenine34) deaminase|tara:strand:+ start:1083 stop:1514 length:432 start_codon:yes stop_codon:yes gene_type:complete